MNKSPKIKDKTFQMRTTEDFLDQLDELAEAIGETRTGAVEFAVNMFYVIQEQNHERDN
jgi:predicted transcriptional regulator